MDLTNELKKLTADDMDLECDPFARAYFRNYLAVVEHYGPQVPPSTLKKLQDELTVTRASQEAIFTVGSTEKSRWSSGWDLWMYAIAGEQDALLELLRLFKQVAGARWVQKRLRNACLKNDIAFIRAYGEAVAFWRRKHGNSDEDLNIWLAVNWRYGSDPLWHKSVQQILQKIKQVGLRKEKGTISERERKNLAQRLSRMGLHKRPRST